MSKIKKMILSALLLTIAIILNRFISIKTEVLIIQFTYIPIMLSAIWLGPKYSTLIAVLCDLLGALLFPFGPYFPGFTVSAGISGLVYGVLLYNHGEELTNKQLIIRLTISSIINLVIVNIFITSFWIQMLYGKAYLVVVASRVVTQLVMIPIQIVTMYGLDKFSRPYVKKYL